MSVKTLASVEGVHLECFRCSAWFQFLSYLASLLSGTHGAWCIFEGFFCKYNDTWYCLSLSNGTWHLFQITNGKKSTWRRILEAEPIGSPAKGRRKGWKYNTVITVKLMMVMVVVMVMMMMVVMKSNLGGMSVELTAAVGVERQHWTRNVFAFL